MRQLEFGHLVVSLHVAGPDDFDDDAEPTRRIRIERADPRIRVSFNVWQAWLNDRDTAMVILNLPSSCAPGALIDNAIGGLVTFTAENGQVLYRVTGIDNQRQVVELAWPD